MGCFSWLLSDTKKALKYGGDAYLPFPKDKGAFGLLPGTILYENSYDCQGCFSGYDIYDLVAIWNRKYLSDHPDYIIPSEKKPISEYRWYRYYCDLSLDDKTITHLMRSHENNSYFSFRYIGIDIACLNRNNKNLPYPIKICKLKENACYENLTYSKDDPLQGCNYPVEGRC